MGNRWSGSVSSESMNEKIDPLEEIRPSKRLKSSESMNPGHHGSRSSSPPTMELSQPSPEGLVHPSPPMDAIESIREIDEKIDPVEQIKPSKRLKSSESMNPGHDGSTRSWSLTMDAMESIREMYEKIDPDEQIGPLTSFIKNQLHKMMNTPSETGSSSSEGWLETVGNSTKLGGKTIDTISTEAEKLSTRDIVKAMVSITSEVMKSVGELQCVLLGLSIAAFAAERYTSANSKDNECKQLLLRILQLAKDIKQYSEKMPDERGKLCTSVGTIVEGAVICCDYMERGKKFRFWSATTAATQLEKTKQQLRDVTDSLALCSLQRHWDKDVFLSHSGKEKNFVRQLYRDLTKDNVSCFFDEDRNSLPLGQRFPPLIFKAAETCKIAVLVISKEFICSKWPMLELAAFIRARNSGRNSNVELFPIFFMISPKELSHITKDSPEWQKLEVSSDTRGEWQHALEVVSSIKGLHFGEDENEVALRDKVINAISFLLKGINRRPQLLDFQPVGIKEQVREVKMLLNMKGAQSALAVIVYGFGGVGKSTLAACVLESLDWSSTDFKFCSVAIDEKTPDKTSHIIKLQKNILYILEGAKVVIRDTLDGRNKIKKALENKCSLLFIDNVVDKVYIQDLLPRNFLFPANQNTKLRIIITSREKNLKAELDIICKEYEVKGLSHAVSHRLLLDTIVQGEKLEDRDFDEANMINEVAAECRGVPLLLSVFGKHLRAERNKDSYLEALDVLREGNLDSYRDEDLGTKLMFVYNKIKNVEVKEAFLDICTYFHGLDWNLVVDIVDFPKLEDLRRRTLVSKSSSGEVIVHDILRFMGMKEARLTRFSNYKELSDALEDNLVGSENVKGISLLNDNCLITIKSTQLEAMHSSLRVLMLGDWVTLDGPPCNRAFTNLRYLSVGDITNFPFEDPSKLGKLRVFVNGSKPGMNLSYLPLSLKRISHKVPGVQCDKIVKLPFQNLSSLKSFIVKTQKSVELPEELHLPAALVDLNINRCNLECLPPGIGQLKKLKYLSTDFCPKLTFLSEDLGMLYSLEALNIYGCQNLRALPTSLGGLLSLQKLELSECIKLQVLPESFGELRIQSLNLHSLVNLTDLPNSFGKMPLLKYLSLESCHSLIALPKSFAQLKMLETLKISECTKLSVLPEDFSQLRCLKDMTVEGCHLLKELPYGFAHLPALKTLTLRGCKSFVNLPTDIPKSTSLEKLNLFSLNLMTRFPNGFGKLQKLRFLYVSACYELKTLSDDFENMATLERVLFRNCPELEGAMMEKILKLQDCYKADIYDSRKIVEKWQHMQGETEHPIMVFSRRDKDGEKRAIKIALLSGKCVEVNNATNQLMERSSLLVGLEEGISATVGLIMLPIQMQSHQHQTLQRYVEMARETAATNGWGKLQIVCARKVELDAERVTSTEEEEKPDEGGIRQILLSLPKGSCAIPSSESKRVKILTCCYGLDSHDELSFFTANVGFDIEGRRSFENCKFIKEKEISGNVDTKPPPTEVRKPENEHYNSIQKFILSICPVESWDVIETEEQSQSQCVAGESKTREFVEALKGNGIDHLLTDNNNSKVMVDDLHGQTIGFIICDFNFLKCIKLEQIYKDTQQKDSNFLWIWIPFVLPKDCGHGSYTRLIQCMPWATFPYPQLVNVEDKFPFGRRIYPCFVLVDKDGQIANHDALSLLLAWGVKSYPFTQHTIPQSFSFMESQSCLEFLMHGMNIVGRKPMRRKMTFLYVASPSEWFKMKSKLEELTQIHGSFEILYVGKCSEWNNHDIENLKKDYENATQNMRWPSLSFSDMIMFWHRCKYLATQEGSLSNKESKVLIETLHDQNENYSEGLVLTDNDVLLTRRGYDMVQMICESSDGEGMAMRMVKDELMKILSTGECSPVVKTFFTDEIHNLPQHSHHRISLCCRPGGLKCHVCGVRSRINWNIKRSYRCDECNWSMCGNCWVAYSKYQVEQLLRVEDDV